MRMDTSHWPRCFLWHGWLRLLSGVKGDTPWAEIAAEVLAICLSALCFVSLRVCFKNGRCLVSLTGRMLLDVCLPTPTFGLMVVLCWISSLVFLSDGSGMLMCLVVLGAIVSVSTLMS